MRQFRAVLWMALVAQVLLPSASRAQVPDHLKCYKIKDSAKKAIYTADLGGLAPEPGCQVKLPAKLICVPTVKTNVNPTPPGAPTGPSAGQFGCYKVKCPKGVPPVVTLTDQFGSRTVQPSAAQLLCAPAQVGSPPTTTTTLAGSTTTTTTMPNCGAAGSPCSTNSDCCSNNCGGGAPPTCQGSGTTTTTTTASSTTSTTTPAPCTSPGVLVGGFCWFRGNGGGGNGSPGDSCDVVCADLGKTCSPATVSYAGTGGTSVNCQAVANALGFGMDWTGDLSSCGTGTGCTWSTSPDAVLAFRCTDVPTTCSALPPTPPLLANVGRFCACM